MGEMIEVDENTNELIKNLLEDNSVGERRLKVRKQLSNVFFKRKLFEKLGSKCSVCGTDGKTPYTTRDGKIRDNPLVIHHKKYDWKCFYDIYKKNEFNCERCYSKHDDNFEKCINNCVRLCDICHFKEHKKLKRTTGQWTE